MTITVKLFVSFREGRFGERELSYADGCTAGEVLQDLGIAEAEVGVLLVNGRHILSSQTLADGDTLSVFPLIGGG